MSLHLIVSCDQQNEFGTCAQHTGVAFVGSEDAAREKAIQRGWRNNAGRDLCPGCARDMGLQASDGCPAVDPETGAICLERKGHNEPHVRVQWSTYGDNLGPSYWWDES